MQKRLKLKVPIYVKKYIEGEYGVDDKGQVKVDRKSELGCLLHAISRAIPYNYTYPEVKGPNVLILSYSTLVKVYDVPPDKIEHLATQLDEMFRSALISEVRGKHELIGGDYGCFVTDFLNRYGIISDVDANWQTMRKIYRDYQDRVAKKRQKIFA
jgi:hypothetical protein